MATLNRNKLAQNMGKTHFPYQPNDVINELNGLKRPDVITEMQKKMTNSRNKI